VEFQRGRRVNTLSKLKSPNKVHIPVEERPLEAFSDCASSFVAKSSKSLQPKQRCLNKHTSLSFLYLIISQRSTFMSYYKPKINFYLFIFTDAKARLRQSSQTSQNNAL